MVSIKQINYALAVEKEMHFKNAADKCFVSASTLSNAISEMEKQLGFEIFERNNKKVIVTKLGEEILRKYKNAHRTWSSKRRKNWTELFNRSSSDSNRIKIAHTANVKQQICFGNSYQMFDNHYFRVFFF